MSNPFTKNKLKNYILRYIESIVKDYEQIHDVEGIVYECLDHMNIGNDFCVPARCCKDPGNVEEYEAQRYFEELVEKYNLIEFTEQLIQEWIKLNK